jgi:predicted transcriptional regulator
VARTAPEASSKPFKIKKSKVHRRSEPAPQQRYFPARTRTIRTYGKGKTRRSLPSKASDQSTLTQIGWIPSTYQEDEDDVEGLIDLITDEEDEAQKGKGKEAARRSSKRRRTIGDLEAVPNSTAGSNFHTQTLTQMPSFMSGQNPDDGELEEDFNIDEHDGGHKVAPKAADNDRKFEASLPVQERKKRTTPSPQKAVVPPPHSIIPSHAIQTPRKQIVERAVIPSSQPSPFTPNLGVAERYWSQLDRTPLKARSTNVDAPTPIASRKRPRTLEVSGSWSTVNGGMSSSPSKVKSQRTPLKEISLHDVAERSIILGEAPIHDDDPTTTKEVDKPLVDSGPRDNSKEVTPQRGAVPSQKSTRPAEGIISDSEDDFEFDLEDDSGANDEAPGTPTPAARVHTQKGIEAMAQETEVVMQSPHKPRTMPIERPAAQRDSAPGLVPEEDEAEPETPSPSPQRRASTSSAVEADKSTPLSSPQKTSPALPPLRRTESGHHSQTLSTVSPMRNVSSAMASVSQLGFRYKSQAFESQRVPFERIQQLGPQTDRSDIIISIHPEQAGQIVEGHKTHEFRNYRIPQTVGRIWLYITRPVCALKYMATISCAKNPGDISYEDPGVGNAEFNDGKGLQFAYELKQVYELNNPVSLDKMKENGWVEEAPAKYVYIPPAVLGELMANLRRALFVEPGQPQSSQIDMTESQELDLQLRSDIAHSTQVGRVASSPARGQRRKAANDAPTTPSSPRNEKDELSSSPPDTNVAAKNRSVFAKPTVPASRSQRSVHWVGGSHVSSPVGVQAQPASPRAEGYTVRPSQATTASAPSSPSQRQTPYRGQPILISSQSQPSIPVSPPTKVANRGPTLIARGSSELISELGDLGDEDATVDDSPVRRHKAGIQTWSDLPGSSQSALALGSGEPDSLLDDSRVRQPPDVVWDSEGEVE